MEVTVNVQYLRLQYMLEATPTCMWQNLPVHTQVQREIRSPCKSKAVPLQARMGPEGSRKLRFPDFVTKAQDGGR